MSNLEAMAVEAGQAGGSGGATTMAAPSTDLPPGFIVGEYRIVGLLGRGGMGTVYAAIQPVIEKKVAIKVLGAQVASSAELVRRFVDEARAVNVIGHENIVDIFSFGQLADGRLYFVMELLEGATLDEHVERGDLTADELGPLLGEICDALAAAHAKKIIHRDLKLENVWIVAPSAGRRRSVRLLDFGIAKLMETADRVTTDQSALMGTPQYMSPEQCQGSGVDQRTDIYAMGVMLYRMFAGRFPIHGDTFAEIICKQLTLVPPAPSAFAPVSEALDRLILACLEKDPARRPATATALGEAIATALGAQARASAGAIGRAGGTVPLPAAQAPRPASTSAAQASRRPVVAAFAVGLLLTIGGGVAWLARPTPPGPKPPAPIALPAHDVSGPVPDEIDRKGPAAIVSPAAKPVSPGPSNARAVVTEVAQKEARAQSDAKAAAKHHGDPERRQGSTDAASRAAVKGLATDNPFRAPEP